MTSLKTNGYLNILSLIKDGLLSFGIDPVVLRYQKYGFSNSVFIGFSESGFPNGFARVIYSDGSIAEG